MIRKVIIVLSFAILGCGGSKAMSKPTVTTEGDPSETSSEKKTSRSLLTLERIFSTDDFKSRSFGPARFMDEGAAYTTLEESKSYEEASDIVRYDTESGKREVLVEASRLVPSSAKEPLTIDDYHWSEDGDKLLVFTNTERVWRKNTRGDYYVLDLGTWQLSKLGGDAEPSKLMFAKFSPDGTRVGYVYERNIYVQNLQNFKIKQLTSNGSDWLINGTSDWVYEEEFGLRDGFKFSSSGMALAYLQFDTTGVPEFNMVNNTDAMYPKITTFKYPKVGQTNSACRIGIVHVNGGKTKWIETGDDLRNNYIPWFDWRPGSDELFFYRMNREQNALGVLASKVEAGRGGSLRVKPVKTIFQDNDDAWVDVRRELLWLGDSNRFALLSERDGWRHLYTVSLPDGETKLLSPGDFDVIQVVELNEKTDDVYFIASPKNPTERYLYKVPLGGGGKPERVTPSDIPGTHRYQVSKGGGYAIHTHSSFESPPFIDLVSLPNHKRLRVLESNGDLQKSIDELLKHPVEFFRLDIGDNVALDGWRILPPDFNPEKKYPLLFYVYGEPAGQTVLNRMSSRNTTYLWHVMLSQMGYIVVSLDNRGTPAPRGREWRKSIYGQVGILASADQAAATKAIVENWKFVDRDRIGIWGWSGGGSMSLNAIFRYPDLYKAAVAIASVPDQRYYDSVYQERYMGLLDNNKDGYKKGSPINFAHQLEGKLLLIHGTGDDNCHYQGFEALVNELIKHNKHFSMFSYPNRTHSIKEGENTRLHLFETITRYLTENLPPNN